MWIVRLALRRPFTIAVMTLLIFLSGLLSMRGMLVDIFPTIDIPVVGVVWNYNGLSAEEMERRVMLVTERAFSTAVNGISRIESDAIPGIGLMRIYFQPGTDIGGAIAQISAMTSTVLRILPPGMTSPVIVQYNASNVPVSQLTLSSKTLPEEKIVDYALNFLRMKLFTIPGLASPAPYGGKARQVNVDINPTTLASKGLSPFDVVTALQASNLIIPAGTARIGKDEFNVSMNSSPLAVEQFNDIPVKIVNGAPVTLREVGRISDGFADQTNIVRINGNRATYLAILKKADASTLNVVDSVREMLPQIKQAAPDGLDMKLDFDQSVFVKSSIASVLREAGVAAVLVSAMVLFFLGSWRSVFVICTSIPLSIFVAIVGLKVTGNSFNIMTLGGLSLAVGMLVDDATVEVENIHRNRALGHPLTVAILTGAQQIALPAIMATLAICVVFLPVWLLEGPARFLFRPMALSVIFSMLASYVLSRTLVPLLCRMVLGKEKIHDVHGAAELPERPTLQERFDHFREKMFGRLQKGYERALHAVMSQRRFTLGVFFAMFFLSLATLPVIGTDFFPTTDAGLMKLHFRAPPGTRIEETEKLVEKAEEHIRAIIPAADLSTINSNIGVPASYNLAFIPSNNVGGMDAEILISLNPDHHPTANYMKAIRRDFDASFPGSTASFMPADIVSQVLNFGLTAAIDVQVEYNDLLKSYPVAALLRDKLKAIPGTADVTIKQVFDYPTIRMNVDRMRAAEVGLTQRDVANSMLISLSSSSLVAPSYFLNPVNNVNYPVIVKTPLDSFDSVEDLLSTSITPPGAASLLQNSGAKSTSSQPRAHFQRLGNLVSVQNQVVFNSVSHYSIARVLDVTANIEGRDLGSVISDVQKMMGGLKDLPKNMHLKLRGQGEVMDDAFRSLGLGLVLAILLVYMLMVVLFQSWLDPFIVMVAVPGALTGILWGLLATGTTLNVMSFMGSIMSVGIAASNSILLVSFANDQRVERGLTAFEAALEAGKTRLRPVLMTALAMVLGMLPTALGLGEGGEQNAPLGRAVIGGLFVATFVTLFVVPVVYSLLRTKMPTLHLLERKFNAEEQGLEFDMAAAQGQTGH